MMQGFFLQSDNQITLVLLCTLAHVKALLIHLSVPSSETADLQTDELYLPNYLESIGPRPSMSLSRPSFHRALVICHRHLICPSALLSFISKTSPGLLQISPNGNKHGHLVALHEYNFHRNKVRKLCQSARKSYYDTKILIHKRLIPRNGGAILSLSTSSPLLSLVHDGVFKSGHELTELIAESFCNVSDDIQPLNFTKTPIDFIPDEFIISTQQGQLELEKINL